MKTYLSHLMPVWRACEVLGDGVVQALVRKLLLLREQATVEPDLVEDLEALLAGLRYRPVPGVGGTTTTSSSSAAADVPPEIASCWRRWLTLRYLSLDKATALPFLLPPGAVPHPGPLGHQGLFDCLVYAVQATAPGSGTASGAGAGSGALNQAVILVPDVLILLAICRQYYERRDWCSSEEPEDGGGATSVASPMEEVKRDPTPQSGKDQGRDGSGETDAAVHLMARVAYRVYDAYQKKGTVARDTLHRFMTDVHGENSYKEPRAAALLDAVFDSDTTHAAGWLGATVNEEKFCRRILERGHMEGNFLLLDWLAKLVCRMIPSEEVPESVQAYLETRNRRPVPLCDAYALAETRLFEVKRRFHSMVQTSTPVIQGDPMESVDSSDDQQPKSSISRKSFLAAVSKENVDMGHGGYLPESLAELVFRAGCLAENSSHSDDSKSVWTLYHVLLFGCTAVRLNTTVPENRDLPLLRFMFNMFQLTGDEDPEDIDRTILTRSQLAKMVLLLIEHLNFRQKAEAPIDIDDSKKIKEYPVRLNNNLEESLIDAEALAMIGLAPTGAGGSQGSSLGGIVDFLLKDGMNKDQMLFDDFIFWKTKKAKTFIGLSRVMLELRLIASVMFGVPPTEASLEIALIGEIEARHKSRFPQTEVSRRGPRGSLWYLIDSNWLHNWAAVMKEVTNTPDDPKDGRDDPQGGRTRGLKRINNKSLLIEGGGLALRPDIRWKHDYEILPPLAWSALHAWYDGGPHIHRSVVKYLQTASTAHNKQSRLPTENELELYPFFVTVYLCDAPSRGEARPFQQNYQVSRVSPVFAIHLQLCKELEIDPSKARLWYLENDPEALIPPSVIAKEIPKDGLRDDWILEGEHNILEQRKRRGRAGESSRDIKLLLELKDEETGLWPRGVDGKDWAFKGNLNKSHEDELGDGIVGLYNMGNTCYMNSTIQCLSHTPIFREYFTSKAYLRDINTKNPLGYEGKLAQVTAVLINSIWKRFNQTAPHQPKRVNAPGSYALVNAPSLTPKTFKESLGKFKDEFAGNEQHDAQEMLNFLLDGLNEDLNRVVEKPYIEQPDSDGRPDHELADIWWENHLKRELSIIVALFTGQYKSLLTCRQCKYESARFEPFSFLQVPLPEDDHLFVTLILYPLKENTAIMRYSVRVKADGKLRDVLIALAKVLETDEAATKGKAFNESDCTDRDLLSKAQNMAVVDMREGYISKIAPNSWSLHDLQNKETGELPVLQVFELDPLSGESLAYVQGQLINSQSSGKELKLDENKNSVEETNTTQNPTKPKYGFVTVAQRRPEVVCQDFLHPFSQRIFGTPLLLRIDNLEDRAGSEIYDLVARRLHNYVPKGAQKFLIDPGLPNGEGDDKVTPNSPGPHPTLPDAEDIAGGSVPRYGFRLRLTTRDGRQCCNCPWFECCIGCTVLDNKETGIVMDSDSLVVDWHFAVDMATSGFGTRSSPMDPISRQPVAAKPKTQYLNIKSHHSVGTGSKNPGPNGCVTLEDCLDAFAKEERIPDTYCSKCRDLRVQTKHMSLWRVPPIVIIQLKRFQFTPNMRRKLRDHVVFPVEGLDLSRIMAAAAGPSPTTAEAQASPPKAPLGQAGDAAPETNEDRSGNGDGGPLSRNGAAGPAGDAQLYDLFGVVHHQGALSAGHYVASIKSELDGQWRLFNDAQIYEIHARDVVDASAYMLFYIRRDVARSKDLSDFWSVRAEGEGGLSEDDMTNLLKGGKGDKGCVIS